MTKTRVRRPLSKGCSTKTVERNREMVAQGGDGGERFGAVLAERVERSHRRFADGEQERHPAERLALLVAVDSIPLPQPRGRNRRARRRATLVVFAPAAPNTRGD